VVVDLGLTVAGDGRFREVLPGLEDGKPSVLAPALQLRQKRKLAKDGISPATDPEHEPVQL
jgi:hypothetical protein